MKPIRFPIHRLMVITAVIAINLAVVRALFATHQADLLVVGILIWFALQIGVARACRTQGRARCFWLGYVSSGTIATLSFVWAMNDPHSELSKPWIGYCRWVIDLSLRLVEASYQRNGYLALHELAFVFLIGLVWALPILLTALIGGLVARHIQHKFGGCPVPNAPSRLTRASGQGQSEPDLGCSPTPEAESV